MLNIRSTEMIITLMTFLIAYAFSVTVAGAFRAWVAEKMGDDTADSMGLTSLNPLAHIDPFGVMFLFLFFFGWGRYVPINHLNIEDPWRRTKISLAYLADTFAYLVSALIGIIILIVGAGPRMLLIAQQMLLCRQYMSHYFLIAHCPVMSSLTITLSFIIICYVYLNVVLGVLTLILNSCSLGVFYILDRSSGQREINYYLVLLVPIILMFLFSETIRIMIIQSISWIGFSISHMIGLV